MIRTLTVTLALGTNLGDRAALLAAARTDLAATVGPVVAASRVAETPAWGVTDQPAFLNQVIVVAYPWPAAAGASVKERLLQLLDRCQAVEQRLGRERKQVWGPRTCDVDLIFAGDLRLETARLSLPHPWWAQRDFVGGVIRRELPWVLPPGSFS